MPYADWRSLLLEHVTTHDELHVLLFLRENVASEVEVSRVARELNLSEQVCLSALQRLTANGLAKRNGNGHFCFSPLTLSLARGVEALEHAYLSAQSTVIQALSESAVQRVRASVARVFPRTSGKPEPER